MNSGPALRIHTDEDLSKPNQQQMLKMFGGLTDIWESSLLSDVTLVIQGCEYPAHKLVLACASDYFRVMFCCGMAESRQDRVEIKNVSKQGIEAVLEFAYTATISLARYALQEVVHAASFLQFDHLLSYCVDRIKHNIDTNSCFQICEMGSELQIEELQQVSSSFILRNFIDLPEEDFVQIPIRSLIAVLKSNSLKVPNEFSLFKKVLTWINFRPSRSKMAGRVLQNVRFPLMTTQELSELSKSFELALTNPEVRKLVHASFQYHASSMSHVALQSSMTSVRSTVTEIAAIIRFSNPSSPDKLITMDESQVWRQVSNVPYSHRMGSESHAVAFHNFLFLVTNNSTFRFDPRFETWLELLPMNYRRSDFVVYNLGHHIFVAGGKNANGRENRIECLDVYKNAWSVWSEVEDFPSDCSVCVVNKQVLISGGYVNNRIEATISSLTHKGLCPVGQMSVARCNHAMAVIDTLVYIYGGVDLPKMDVFDSASNQIVRTVQLDSRCLREISLVNIGSTCYIFGGFEWSSMSHNKEFYQFDTTSDSGAEVKVAFPDSTRILTSSKLTLKPTERDRLVPKTVESSNSSLALDF